MNWFYNLVIAAGGAIIGLLTFTDEIARKIKYFSNLQSLLFKIPFFLLATIMIVWATNQKDFDNEEKQDQQNRNYAEALQRMDSVFKEEKRRSDSIHANTVRDLLDSSYAKSIKASNEALAKYNLIFIDSLHSVASTLNMKSSSAQLSIAAVTDGMPPLYIVEDSTGTNLKIKYVSVNGTCYNIQINIYIVRVGGLASSVFQYEIDQSKSEFLVPNVVRTVSLPLNSLVMKSDILTVIIIGRFSRDEKGTSLEEFKSAYSFDFNKRKFMGKAGINYPYFFKLLHQYGIPY